MLSKFTLTGIKEIQKVLCKNNELNGKYDLMKFIEDAKLEYATEATSLIYVKDKRNGDHVTEKEVVNGKYDGIHNLVWTAKVAEQDLHCQVDTSSLDDKIKAGTCFRTVKNVSSGDNPLYVTEAYLTVPEGHAGMIQRGVGKDAGYIIIVPDFELEAA
jgi:hypothetical protein